MSGHAATVVTDTWPVTKRSRLNDEPPHGSRARQGADPRREPDRAVPVRARARRLTPAALCGYVQQAGDTEPTTVSVLPRPAVPESYSSTIPPSTMIDWPVI